MATFLFEAYAARLATRRFHRPGWIYEEKYDGWRILAYKEGRGVLLVSRPGKDHTATFPAIAAAVASLPAPTLVLDGEVCVFDETLVSQHHLMWDAEPGAVVTPPMYAVFDCLHARRHDLWSEPLVVRRQVLEAEVGDRHELLFPGRRLAPDGLQAWADVTRRGCEGLVAKDEASPYLSGVRSERWLKVKLRHEGQFFVGGVTKDRGGWTTVLLGIRNERDLRYVGGVRFGVTRRLVAELFESWAVIPRSTSPFADYSERGAVWLEPHLVAEVSFGGSVERGLRDPVLRRLVHAES